MADVMTRRSGPRPRPVLERLISKIEVGGPVPTWAPFLGSCWIWTGAKHPDGYGRIGVGSRTDGSRRSRGAHVVAYELLVGPIPEGLHLDHLCRTPSCVRPDHLEPGTPAENLLRGQGWAARNARKTKCPAGHNYDGRVGDRRTCSQCRKAQA